MEPRFVFLALWGGVCVLTYGVVMRRRFLSWRLHHHDARSKRELVSSIALFLTALASALSIAFLLFGPIGTGLRGFAVAMALGAFAAAGVVMATEAPREDVVR